MKGIKYWMMLCLVCLGILILPIHAKAWEAHLNEAGDIEIYTVDKRKTSDIWYYTEGVTITRCQYNPTTKEIHESSNWVAAYADNTIEVLQHGTYFNTWTIPLNDVIEIARKNDSQWAEEIKNAVEGTGPAVYIKLDCIMYTVDEINEIEFGPFVNVPGVFGSNGNLTTGVDVSGVQIINAYPWANPNGLKTHYNHYLLIGSGVQLEPIVLSDEFVTYDYTMDHYANIDANQPAFAMRNYSSQFDLSQGIPSSEYIDNAFLSDSWFGNTNVYARVVGQEYTHRITYRWANDNGYYQWFDDDGDGVDETRRWVTDIDTYSETHDIPIGTAFAAFEFLADTHIYDFTNADIINGAYDGDHIYYDDTHEVPMTCISTAEYKDIAASGALIQAEPDWVANTDDHVTFGTFSYKVVHDFGLISGKPDIATQVIADRDAIRALISNNVKTRNDKLVIDGHTFMKNNWVTGCDFFDSAPATYKSCTKSAGWVNDYCLQAGIRPLHEYDPADVVGNVTVQIPSTVDNGYYATAMKVYYQRLITYSKTPMLFEAGY